MRAVAQITARLGSTRLPRKMLRDLAGAPVIIHVISRVQEASRPDEVVLATTREPQDDALADIAAHIGVRVVRGPSEDVIARWLQTARETDADLVVNVDGDDVLCDPSFIDRVVDCHTATRADYITVQGLPLGAAPTGYSRRALERVCALKDEDSTEGQGRFFADPEIAAPGVISAPCALRHDSARMTLDYPEDLEFFAAIVRELGHSPQLQSVVELLHRRPEIVAINSGRQAEYWDRFTKRYPPVQLRRP